MRNFVPFEMPPQEEIDEIILEDYSGVQPPYEAWGVTEEELDMVDAEALAKSEEPAAEEF